MKLIYAFIFSFIFLISSVSAATLIVADPVDCPSSDGTNFPGQNCAPDDICGDASGTAQCFDTSTISAPSANATTSSGSFGGFDGGFVLNCYATADAAAPFCDNNGAFLCDRQDSCFNVGRQTICVGGSFNNADCSASCRTDGANHFACDGSTIDADGCEIRVATSCGAGTGTIDSSETCFSSSAGNCTRSSDLLDCDNDDSDGNNLTCNGANGCEVNPGSSCTVGGLAGTIANSCPSTCVITPQHHLTNESAIGSSTHPNLQSIQLGSGGLANFTNGITNQSLVINNSACIILPDGTPICSSVDLGGGAPVNFFDQDLNTTSNATFNNLTITEEINVGGNVTANFFLGLFNWVIGLGSEYLSFNGGTLDFNESFLNGTVQDLSLNQTEADVIYIASSSLPLANQTLPYCGNVTGSDFDVCTNPDTNLTDGGNIFGTLNVSENITAQTGICFTEDCAIRIFFNGSDLIGVG